MAVTTILHPTDFSEHSAAALAFACSLAKQNGSKLLIVHVADYSEPPTVLAGSGIGIGNTAGIIMPPPVEEGAIRRSTLEDQLEAISPTEEGITVQRRLLEGEPAVRIVEVALEADARQIVMGSHGRRGLSRVVMGSVAESVLRQAPCPVTIVKGESRGRGVGPRLF